MILLSQVSEAEIDCLITDVEVTVKVKDEAEVHEGSDYLSDPNGLIQ